MSKPKIPVGSLPINIVPGPQKTGATTPYVAGKYVAPVSIPKRFELMKNQIKRAIIDADASMMGKEGADELRELWRDAKAITDNNIGELTLIHEKVGQLIAEHKATRSFNQPGKAMTRRDNVINANPQDAAQITKDWDKHAISKLNAENPMIPEVVRDDMLALEGRGIRGMGKNSITKRENAAKRKAEALIKAQLKEKKAQEISERMAQLGTREMTPGEIMDAKVAAKEAAEQYKKRAEIQARMDAIWNSPEYQKKNKLAHQKIIDAQNGVGIIDGGIE